jgi:hypothetical protein
MSAVTAIFSDGVFRPTEPVQLPDNCEVDLQFHVRFQPSQATEPSSATTARSIEDQLASLAAEAPSEEWDQLPADLSNQLDHYVYGTPRE